MSNYAIIETGAKQYWVEPNQVLQVEKIEGSKGKTVSLTSVLLARSGDKIEVGTPTIKGAQVICDYLGEIKGDKVTLLKYTRRKNYRRKKGHRQILSKLLVKEIKI